MQVRFVTTSDYTDDARERLGAAVADARTMAGFRSRSDLAREADISLRSLDKVELGKPGVGRRVLLSIARVLPGWDVDTPRSILEGAPVPEPITPEPPKDDTHETGSGDDVQQQIRPTIGTREWLIHYAKLLRPSDFVEVREVLLRMMKAETETIELAAENAELKRLLAECQSRSVKV